MPAKYKEACLHQPRVTFARFGSDSNSDIRPVVKSKASQEPRPTIEAEIVCHCRASAGATDLARCDIGKRLVC